MTGGMGSYSALLRPLLFRLEAESVHNLALWAVARGLVRCKLVNDPRLAVEAMGLRFANPLGLAAGFDKNAIALRHWQGLGFGFVEVGTVTPVAQPGNPKPRLFRLPQDQAIINRMGFNNEGIASVAKRLASDKCGIPVGVNLGANKSTATDEAWRDYETSFRVCHELGDYFVVNVSSPNTPGLRSLQNRDDIAQILTALKAINASKPILVKIAPDLEEAELIQVAETALASGCAGIIASNTTIARPNLTTNTGEAGGLSGAPLRGLSNRALMTVKEVVGDRGVVIGVGGIFEAADVIEKMRIGASLVQLYTGWIYGGPTTVPRILNDLILRMDAARATSLTEFIGAG